MVSKWAKIIGVSLAVSTFFFSALSGAFRDKSIIEQARAEIPQMRDKIGNLEAAMQIRQMEYQVVCSDIVEIKGRLERIENKIDRIIESR